MYLEKLELQGFKTFVRKTELNFPQPRGGQRRGVAAIVGPNGSGKSNLSDAIRWVMGEQSLKSLRGKKSEDVIFSGTESLARVGMAEVSLYVNNEDRQAPIDYSQVVVTRRLNRSGESEYLINRNRVRLQDVSLLLAQASFGQKTYSIIGQGMVDAILMAGPLERKSYFDEASGTRPLQLKRDDAAHKLNEAEENMRQGEALIQEITPRLRSLTRQVKRLERRDEVERELTAVRHRYYGTVRHENNTAFAAEQAKLAVATAKKTEADQLLTKLEAEFAGMEKKESDGEFQRLEAEQQRVWNARSVLAEKLVRAKSALAAEAGRTRRGTLSIEVLTALYYDLESAVADLTAAANGGTAVQVADIVERLRRHVASMKQQVVGGDGDTEEHRRALETEVAALQAEDAALNQAIADQQEKMRSLRQNEQQRNQAVFDLERKVRAATESARAAAAEESDCKVAHARLAALRESLDREIAEELGGEEPPVDQTLYSVPEKTAMRQQIETLKRRLSEIGTIDEETANEYEATKTRHDFLTREIDDLTRATHDLKKVIRDLDETIARQFNESFQRISHDFERFFKILFNGGTAKLLRINLSESPAPEDDDADETASRQPEGVSQERMGVDIQATPPGKRLKHISMLSGGERALTSLALICAIISSNPSPFVVLDEVDAALDEANSVRFAEIIDQLSHRTQFIVITHNRATMHQANILYGVTMGEDGASRLLSLKLEDIEKRTA